MAKLQIATFIPLAWIGPPLSLPDRTVEHEKDTFAEHDLMAKLQIATFLPLAQI